MKITRNQLRRLIKEELGHLLEQVAPVEPGAADAARMRELFGLTRQAPDGCVRAMGKGPDEQAAFDAALPRLNTTNLGSHRPYVLEIDGEAVMEKLNSEEWVVVIQACAGQTL